MTDAPSPVRFLNPDTLPTPPGYSQLAEVRGGRTVYVAGQVALDAESRLVGEGDFEAQARQAFANLGRALAAAGLGFEHVVKLTLFLTDASQIPALRRVRDEFVNTAAPPTSTALQVAALARPEWLFEVDAVAVGPD